MSLSLPFSNFKTTYLFNNVLHIASLSLSKLENPFCFNFFINIIPNIFFLYVIFFYFFIVRRDKMKESGWEIKHNFDLFMSNQGSDTWWSFFFIFFVSHFISNVFEFLYKCYFFCDNARMRKSKSKNSLLYFFYKINKTKKKQLEIKKNFI